MAKYQPALKLNELVAIDVHTHANLSSRQPRDPASLRVGRGDGEVLQVAPAADDSGSRAVLPRAQDGGGDLPRRYRERNRPHGASPTKKIAEVAAENNDVLIPFASIDPAKGKMGAREARRLIEDFGVRGFKFHPSAQGFYPNDRKAYGLYEVIAGSEAAGAVPQRPDGRRRAHARRHGHPAASIRTRCSSTMWPSTFPDMPIVIAHPSFPWQDEALAVATHKPNVYIDLSGWSPKYFPTNLVQYANTLLKDRVMFGSDFPGADAGALDRRLRHAQHQARSAAADHERERRAPAGARARRKPA